MDLPDALGSSPDPWSAAPFVDSREVVAATGRLVDASLVHDLLVPPADGRYRARILTIERVFFALLQFVLGRFRSFAALVSALRAGTVGGLGPIAVSNRAFTLRLESLPHASFLAVLVGLTARLRTFAVPGREWVRALAPFATGLYAIDDTTLDALARKVATLAQHPKGAPETLAGRLGAALDLVTGQVAAVLYDTDALANEKNHLLPLVEVLGAGALVVMDLGYFSFALFDALSERYVYWVSRLRAKTSMVVIATLADRPGYRDRIVYLGAWAADRAAYPVRCVELEVDGTSYAWLTNVLEPRMLSAADLWALYGQRWTIEVAFAALKRGLGLAYLRACHTNGVLIQVWCALCVYQVLQHLRLVVAASQGWEADRVSWERLIRGIGFYAQLQSPLPLVEYLCTPVQARELAKQGTRVRRKDLSPKVRAACEPTPSLPDDLDLKARKPRHGKPEARTKRTITVVAGLQLLRGPTGFT